jgi:XTP/dITP diphosphohydrolase
MNKKLAAFSRLLTIMDELREKCPWDRKQTMQSLRNLTIEETYELADAILADNLDEVKEEIGDIMLHMVFYAKIAEEQGAFDIAEALEAICDKLVARHPHIYDGLEVAGEEEVKRNWENLKLRDGKRSVLGGVPDSLPAMVKAYRMQEKTRQIGFDWDNAGQAFEKVVEEIHELRETMEDPSLPPHRREEELGDLFFSLINYARLSDLDPETALARVNKKFKERFEYIEAHAPRRLEEMSLEEMDALWNEAKARRAG